MTCNVDSFYLWLRAYGQMGPYVFSVVEGITFDLSLMCSWPRLAFAVITHASHISKLECLCDLGI